MVVVAVTAEYRKSAWRFALLMYLCIVALWLFNELEGVVLNHSRNLWWRSLLTSLTTEKTCKVFQFHTFAVTWSPVYLFMILPSTCWARYWNVVLCEACSSVILVSLLVAWCLSSSPTGAMIVCISSSQVSTLHLQKNVLILFSCGCFSDRLFSCFCHTFDPLFNIFFLCDSQKWHLSLGNSTLVANIFAAVCHSHADSVSGTWQQMSLIPLLSLSCAFLSCGINFLEVPL